MKRIVILLSGLILSLIMYSQDVNDIMEHYFKARGMDKILEAKGFIRKAKVNQMGMEFPLTIYQLRPNLFKSVVEVQGQQIISGYDGENAWTINPMTGSTDVMILSGEQKDQIKDKANMDGELYNWKEKGNKLVLTGTEDMDGKKVYVLDLDTHDGDHITYYMDADSYLIVKDKRKMDIQGTPTEIVRYSSNYKKIHGISYPMDLVVKLGDQVYNTITFEEIIVNPDLDADFFKMPEKQ